MMDFSEARRAFRELGKRHFAGKLSRADYRVEVLNLGVLDDEGHRWRIHPDTGRWQRLEDGVWVNDSPDRHEAAASGEVPPGVEYDIPIEIVGAVMLVLLVLVAAATIAYLSLNAVR